MEVHQIDLGGVSGAGGAALRLDSDGLIDLNWASQMQATGLMDFCQGVRTDSAIPLARDLNYVLQHVREQYRPLKYAAILPTDNVPDWAERWEVSKITGTGSVQLASQVGREDIVTSDLSRDTATGRMYEVVNGYKYWMREMIRAAKLGVNPQVERAMIQQAAAEEFLDALCATGLAGSQYGSGGAKDLGLGLTGLGNDTNVTGLGVLTGTNKSTSTTSWTTAVAADYALVLDDLHNGVNQVAVNSKERHKADTVVMSLANFNAINRLRPANFSANVLSTFLEEWEKALGRPGRVMVWDRFSTIGTVSSGPRNVYFDSSDKNVAARIVGKEYGVDQVREVTRAFEANASLVTGGVRILDASGIVYQDLAA